MKNAPKQSLRKDERLSELLNSHVTIFIPYPYRP